MKTKAITLSELAALTQSKLVGDPKYIIYDVADLESATPHDISFLANPRYEKMMTQSDAGAIFITPSIPLIPERNFLVNENPSLVFQKAVEIFHPPHQGKSGFQGIHPTAVIHPTAKIGKEVTIGPYVVVEQYSEIGDRTTLSAGSYVGPYVVIGEDCTVYPHVTIRECCILGNRVILQPGVVIGSCGFGYFTDKQGKHTKFNQVGNVVIEDDVEIGANATIDRARFKSTRIGKGTKVDNLVQIAHGVEIGQDSILAAQTGIAGSTKLGNRVTMGGQVAVAGHLEIADGVTVAGRSGVTKSLKISQIYSGMPAAPIQEHNRSVVYMRNLDKLHQRLKALEESLLKSR